MKKIQMTLLTLLMSFILFGCSDDKVGLAPSKGPFVYYINSSVTGLVQETFVPRDENSLNFEELLAGLSSVPTGEGYLAPLNGITIIDGNLVDGKLVLEFGREYNTLTGIREVLVRASVVKTLTQCVDVNQVEFNVGGEPLVGNNGEPIGPMDESRFVDYFGKEQDALLSDNFTIYYATEDGSGLKREIHRVYYENTLSPEQAVIRAMQEAPDSKDSQLAIAKGINILNITTTDGTCHLDMDMSFYDPNTSVNQTVSLMAIVNSLCELEGVRQVKVNIIDQGDELSTDSLVVNLSGTYGKNNDLVVN